jgi:hypothetical protein
MYGFAKPAFIFVVLWLSTASLAGARTDRFHAVDADQNATIDKVEARTNTAILDNFHKIDRDKNGAIDKAEFSNFQSADRSRAQGGFGAHGNKSLMSPL